MYKMLYIVITILFLLGSVYLTKEITKRYKVNRWIIGFSSPFVILIPLLIFKELPIWAWTILLIIFSFMCIMFFEITRQMVENNEIKGVAKFDTKKKNK
ncbi:hypothetical protein SAMN05444401_2813 [Clostridium amylolyticum]|uniref:Uncharacterized protein n=1 Tax=Clostridium amylolyticum TaxID=1121298 RepID=A0A1M6IGI8_9CLOT|nr:hypothetical protein [Clostridium amylolyticum]SHJ33571.1 hypothetical protein SAMN05444401_2813 [Clostridium amylolyticum]